MAGIVSFGRYVRAQLSELLDNPKEIIQAVNREFQKLEESQDPAVRDAIILSELSAEPNKLYDGMIARADGVAVGGWDPGSGKGLYVYVSGTGWVLIV